MNMDHGNLLKSFEEGEWERGRIMEGMNQGTIYGYMECHNETPCITIIC
jgi:hypothetical protein